MATTLFTNNITFEGATSNAHETTISVIDPTADSTINLPAMGAGTYHLPVLAASSTTSITATPAELNILDGVTSSAAELNILDGVTSTAAELNILDGVTSSTAELNILDGVTSTTAELNILDGVTSTTAELNILDGVTSTAAELNLVDGSAAGTIVNSKAVVYGSSGEVNATTLQIAGTAITSTAAELNILDGVTSTAVELNMIKKSVRVATTANGVLNSAFANLQTVDGVTLATGNRILIKNQTNKVENGIYVVEAAGAPTRATDFNSTIQVTMGAFTFVEEGTTNASQGFVCKTTGSFTLDTNDLEFTQFSGGVSTLGGLSDVTQDSTEFTNSFLIQPDRDGSAPTTGTLSSANNNLGIGNSVFSALSSGSLNVCLGHQSGNTVSSGANNTTLGALSAISATADNQTAIGYEATCNAANQITLGNSSVTALRCADTTIASLSDQRDKTDIVDSSYGLDFVSTLRPVQFKWDRRNLVAGDETSIMNGKSRVGFIAQELQAAMPNNENDILDLVYDVNPERIEAKYGNLIPILTKAIQDLSTANDALTARVAALESA